MSTKRIVSGVLALALALTFVAPVAAGADTMTTTTTTTTSGYTFTTSLTIGSRGADVVALQSFLVAKGLLTMPAGVAMGYFGALTRSAVSAYQVSKGITPTAGYFGPITRASVAADMASMGGTTTSTTPGCVAGAAYSSTTGQPCTTTTTGGTTTTTGGVTFTHPGEATADVRLAASPADNANIQTQTDVPVYGLEVRARQADAVVQRLDLQFDVTASSASETPSTLINTIKVWDGSTLLTQIPVTTGTFTKDSSNRYYIRLTGFNFLVPKDTTKVLTVSVSTNSIDTTRTVTIHGYLTSSVRVTDSTGVSTFYDASTLSRTHTFKKPGSSTLTLSSDPSVLRAQNYRLSVTDGAQGVVLNTFNVKSETGPSTITQATALIEASGTVPTTLYLYDGSTLLSSKSVSATGATISFDNLSLSIPQDTIKTLTVKADFSSATASGSAASSTVTSVTYDKPNGSSATVSATISGPAHRLFGSVPKFTLASIVTSAPSLGGTNASSSDSQYAQAVFTFNVTANGNTMAKMAAGDFNVTVASSSAATNYASATISSVTTIPDRDIADGGTAQVIVTARLDATRLPLGTVDENFVVSMIKWGFSGTASTTQTWGLEDFRSGPVTARRVQ